MKRPSVYTKTCKICGFVSRTRIECKNHKINDTNPLTAAIAPGSKRYLCPVVASGATTKARSGVAARRMP